MAFFDMPLENLVKYKPEQTVEKDFDSFWENTLSESRKNEKSFSMEPIDFYLKTIDIFDVTYSGYMGQPVKGWLLKPKNRKEKIPCVVHYIGYGGGRGFPTEWLLWPSAGYALFVMDTRGQGSTWQKGDTPDAEPEGSNPQYPGFMTRGVLNPETYYYRRVFTDAVLAVDLVKKMDDIDRNRIAVTGGSQGGGITLAVSGLVPDLSAVMPDVPFLCNFKRATEITDSFPYNEIVIFCKIHRDKIPQIFRTLSYFDGMNFASRAKSRALFSTALMDDICPPSTVYAAYNYYGGEKRIVTYEYNRHEGGQAFQDIEKLKFLNQLWG